MELSGRSAKSDLETTSQKKTTQLDHSYRARARGENSGMFPSRTFSFRTETIISPSYLECSMLAEIRIFLFCRAKELCVL